MTTAAAAPTGAPARAGIALTALTLGALVCNINLAVANVALPDIGRAFAASQTSLNLIAIGCTLGLAMSVLYFGAVGDRYGRKQLLVIGLAGTIGASLLSAYAPGDAFLAAARLLTGLFGGMSYPTTLALITALWAPGIRRTRAIALWSGVSAGAASLGPAVAGFLLSVFWWGSVFLVVVPLAAITLVLVIVCIPKGVNESTDRVDHLGGVLSVVMVGAFVLSLSLVASRPTRVLALLGFVVSVVALVLFFWRQRAATSPLYDLRIARRRLFWVPAVGGMIVFGSLMGAAFVGQQFLQNVVGASPAVAGLSGLPCAVFLVIAAQLSARLVVARGSRFTMVLGYAFVLVAFVSMFFWSQDTGYALAIATFVLVGSGAGLALTPASRSLTGSTPVRRVGMASATSDLQRDLGGSVMQALFGTILAAGFAASFAQQIADSADASGIGADVQNQLRSSFSSAAETAQQFPQYADQIIAAAKESFLHGSLLVFVAGAVAVVLGGLVVLLSMPGRRIEQELTEEYAREDAVA
ncbi:MAG: MFS transporter [Microbacterium sp.]|uniref:MFS transporter n=1 Tax=Microbacterium sp. TaxID=51671 RepID=UPI0039E4C6D9